MTQLPLTDALAIDRTTLANERTLLAYMRTAMGFFVLAVSGWKLFSSDFFDLAGIAMGIMGLLTLAIGAYRFLRIRKHLERARVRRGVEEI